MPTYEYHCDKCDYTFEKIQGFNDPVPACPACGGVVKRVFYPPNIHYRGTGFYSTDKTAPSDSHLAAKERHFHKKKGGDR